MENIRINKKNLEIQKILCDLCVSVVNDAALTATCRGDRLRYLDSALWGGMLRNAIVEILAPY
jgi:hypothetical protein